MASACGDTGIRGVARGCLIPPEKIFSVEVNRRRVGRAVVYSISLGWPPEMGAHAALKD